MNNVLIRINDVRKYYQRGKRLTKALDGVSLDIMAGEILGLLGVNGAGKTTLSSILASIHPATSGSVTVNGKSITDDLVAYRRMIGFCPQKINLDDDLTVEQNLRFAGCYMGMSEALINDRVTYFLTEYGLEKYRHFKSSELSGGYARRVLIARALIHEPKLVILDEPTVGLDPHVRLQLWQTIRELKDLGVTVVLTTHYLDEAEYLSDRICVLEKGKVRLIDTPAGMKSTYQKSRLEDVFIQMVNETEE